jgi:glycosyltransferase involved in cell wall biosynthesis
MKILFVSDSYYPHVNGVYYFVSRVGPLLQERGHEVAVIAPSGSIHSFQKKIDGLDVYGLASLPLLSYPTIRIPIPILLKSRINRIIKSFKPDIIHIQDHFLISKAVVDVNRDLKIPIIGTNHLMSENFTAFLSCEYLKKRFENFLWKGFSRVFNQVDLVTTPSETGARLIRPKLKVNVIALSNGVSLDKFNPSGDSRKIRVKYGIPDKPVLLYVGRLDPEKHIEEILKSVAAAVEKIDFRFVIVGKGTRKAALEQLTRNLGITDKVIFTGFVPDEDLPYLYKLSRCFIIASIAELLSLVTLQAMASGLPIIAVNAGALSELVKDRINGFLYSEGDIPEIIRNIQEIMMDDDLRRKMSEKSLQFARQHDINKVLESFERIYYLNIEKGVPAQATASMLY